MKRVILRRLTVYFVVFGLILSVAVYFIEKQGYRRAADGILMPVQSPSEGRVHLAKDGNEVDLEILYEYTLEGLVVITEDYSDNNQPWNVFSPKDLTLVWGKVAQYNKEIDFDWKHSNRHSYHKLDPYVVEKYFGGSIYLNSEVSNNHVIPADDRVRKEIDMVRRGDHIIIEGYLVNAEFFKGNVPYGKWESSVTRYDTGDGACEVIYVTNIKWIAD